VVRCIWSTWSDWCRSLEGVVQNDDEAIVEQLKTPEMSANSPIIAVIGGANPTPKEAAAAEAVGRALAEGGAILICGGRGGVMEAACRGAKAAGGLTIGILPGSHRGEANPYVDIPIVTGIGVARNAVIARTAQAAVAVGGSYGTLSEIAFALAFGVPVVGLGTWEIGRAGHPPAPITYTATAEEAAAQALALARPRQ
jgi:uncharacterized protein (TIGR00725 family)